MIDRFIGARPVCRAAAAATSARFRILAYHDIPDAEPFARHVEHLVRDWRPVSGHQVAEAVRGGAPLPDRAVWMTFDDGRPNVVVRGLPVLEEHGVPATLYVCPSVIDTGIPLWWQILECRPGFEVAVDRGPVSGRALVNALKRVPDEHRREVLAEAQRMSPAGPEPPQLSLDLVRRWLDSGRELGNHTWDHPLLDRCSAAAQAEQIDRAHEWLKDVAGIVPEFFAYPNGDHTEAAAGHLEAVGYRTAPVFDHRLASTAQDPFGLSRLRIDADAPLDRARAIVSGGHSMVFHVWERTASLVRRSA